MSAVDVVLQVFRAVEQRNTQLALEVSHRGLEFYWPPSLPYGGSSYGLEASLERRPGWTGTWNAFQAEADQLDPQVVAASEDAVAVLWRQRLPAQC